MKIQMQQQSNLNREDHFLTSKEHMAKQFDYQSARSEGYSDDEILDHLSKQHPKYDVKGAIGEGYSPEEVIQHLSARKEKSFMEKATRLGQQAAIGAAENAALPYELAAANVGQREAQTVKYRESVFDDIEQLKDQKQTGVWSPDDQKLLDSLVDQVKSPEKADKFVKTANIGVRGIAEAVTGQHLHPEGVLEKAASWVGFLKDPAKLASKATTAAKFLKDPTKIKELGISGKEIAKSLLPGQDEIRGLSAGSALELAEQGKLGPLGTIAAAVAGDLIGHAPKAALKVASNPKKAAATLTNLFTGANSQKEWTKQLIEDAREAGIQLDAGTITDSSLVKFAQAKAAQSGLTGEALDNFRKDLSGQIVKEYSNILEEVGAQSFENSYQAAEAIQDTLKVQERNLGISRQQADTPASLKGRVDTEFGNLAGKEDQFKQELLTKIAPKEFETSAQAGETLKTVAEDIKQPIKEEFDERFKDIRREVGYLGKDTQAKLASDVGKFVREHEGSLLLGESTAEAKVLKAAQKLKDQLVTSDGALIGVSLQDLIKTRRTLGDVANWEFGGSNFESAYKTLVGEINEAIDRTLKDYSPRLFKKYKELNAEYAAYKDMFEQKNLRALFEPKNNNYNKIYNDFISDPDKLQSLDDIFYLTKRGEEAINQVKRDYAEKFISKQNLTDKEVRNLQKSLGDQHAKSVEEYVASRKKASAAPKAAKKQPLPVVPQGKPAATKSLAARKINETAASEQKRMYEYLSKKTPDQILKQMDTIDGIKRLRHALQRTEEGKQLFKDLSRYKLDDMISKKMTDSAKEQVKLGKFSNLLSTGKNREIAKELLSKEAYQRLTKLQSISGKLAESANKFLNTSQSGSTVADMSLVSSIAVGIMTGNPFLVFPAVASVGGMRMISNLLADPQYLKYLEEAVIAPTPARMNAALEKMRPLVEEAIEVATKQQAISQGEGRLKSK